MASIADGGGLSGLDGDGVELEAEGWVSDGVASSARVMLVFLDEATSLVAGSMVGGDGGV